MYMISDDTVKKVITFEEHFVCPEVDAYYRKVVDRAAMRPVQLAKLDSSEDWVKQGPVTDFGKRRLEWMDKRGIDMQVLQYGDNCPSDLPASEAVPLCREVNDYLAEQIKTAPERYAGFATLPMDSPEEAAKEAERAVRQLGFKGIGFKATYGGKEFLDNKRFEPMWEAIASLKVPVSFHPNATMPKIVEAYYEGDNLSQTAVSLISGYGIGWHYEAGIAYLRAVCAGLLDRYPNLKMIIGHWGEVLPMYLDRLDLCFAMLGKGILKKNILDYFRDDMYVSPSGMYNEKYFDLSYRACLEIFGEDHMLWSNDYPYLDAGIPNNKEWINNLNLSFDAKEKIAHINAEKLLGL